MAAFRLAWERKDRAIELDVHLPRDGALIVSHDADTKRTTGTKMAIKESLEAELRALDAGRWKGPLAGGEPGFGRSLVEHAVRPGPDRIAEHGQSNVVAVLRNARSNADARNVLAT